MGEECGGEPFHNIGKLQDRAILDDQPLTHRVARVAAAAHVVAVNDALTKRSS